MDWLRNVLFDVMHMLQGLLRDLTNWLLRCVPLYQPSAWNTNGIQLNNNCYNYACDKRTDTFAVPGRGSGYEIAAIMDCADIDKAAQSDGLVPVDYDNGCSGIECSHLVALVIRPELAAEASDFHWYRRDRDGHWSHKRSDYPATNLDQSLSPITDPRTADRGLYTIFCGCYCVRKSVVTIK